MEFTKHDTHTHLWIQTIAKLTDARSNLVKMDRLFAATALDNVHGHGNVGSNHHK
jgi:hypothetical protein